MAALILPKPHDSRVSAICHWKQVINLLNSAMIRSLQAQTLSIRWAVFQSLQLFGRWGHEDSSKTASNKRDIWKRLHSCTDKSSFDCSVTALDLLRTYCKFSNSRFLCQLSGGVYLSWRYYTKGLLERTAAIEWSQHNYNFLNHQSFFAEISKLHRVLCGVTMILW